MLVDAPGQVHVDVAEDRDEMDSFGGMLVDQVDDVAEDSPGDEMNHENHDSLGGLLVEGTGSAQVDVALAEDGSGNYENHDAVEKAQLAAVNFARMDLPPEDADGPPHVDVALAEDGSGNHDTFGGVLVGAQFADALAEDSGNNDTVGGLLVGAQFADVAEGACLGNRESLGGAVVYGMNLDARGKLDGWVVVYVVPLQVAGSNEEDVKVLIIHVE
jgi:hypothetical protein